MSDGLWYRMTWSERASCRGSVLDFTSESVAVQEQCLRVCASCPVRPQCLNEGQETGSVGVWGGVVLVYHGRSRYVNFGCRCLECRNANAVYHRQRRAA